MSISFFERLFWPVSEAQGSIATAMKAMTFWERISPPEDISTNGHLIEWLFNYTTYVNIFWFALVCIGLFGFSYVYSQRRHKKAFYTHGNEKKHLLITAMIGAGVFFSVDMVITKVTTQDMKEVFWNFPNDSEDIIKVQVLAQQWAWNFRYAGEDAEFNTGDDVVQLNHLVIPVGKKIMLQMTAKDVIHSLFIPNVRLKADLIPGRYSKMWFDANKEGTYDIACAEMCGTSHYLMKAKLTVLSQENYDRWVKESQAMAIATNDTDDADLRWGWAWGSR
jgi:cytochrome c oxidase subunit II